MQLNDPVERPSICHDSCLVWKDIVWGSGGDQGQRGDCLMPGLKRSGCAKCWLKVEKWKVWRINEVRLRRDGQLPML